MAELKKRENYDEWKEEQAEEERRREERLQNREVYRNNRDFDEEEEFFKPKPNLNQPWSHDQFDPNTD